MAKNRKENLPRTHKIMNHPYLALVLMPVMLLLILLVVQSVLQSFLPEAFERYQLDKVTYLLVALLGLKIFKGWFKGEYAGSLSFRHFKKGMLLLVPTLVLIILNLTEIEYSSVTARSFGIGLLAALAVGFMEETAFRGLSGANYMRVHPDAKSLPLFATLSAVLFGVLHMGNVSAGQPLDQTLMQILYAFGIGVLYAAVYFRTGSLIPLIVSHALIDLTSFLCPANTDPINLGTVIFDIGIGVVMAVIGYWFIRPAKRCEIAEVWAEKWLAAPAEPEAQEEPVEVPQA